MFGWEVETENLWANKLYIFGGVVVLLATVVTLGASFVIWKTSDSISARKDAEASKRERDFQAFKIDASRETANALAEAAIAREAAAKADEAAAKSAKETAQITLQLETFKSRYSWRELNQAAALTLARNIQDRGTIRFIFPTGDTEAAYFVYQLAKVFMDNGWLVESDPTTWGGNIVLGVTIPSSQSSKLQTVRSAFSAAQIPFSMRSIPPPATSISAPPNPDEVFVVVGSKPPPI